MFVFINNYSFICGSDLNQTLMNIIYLIHSPISRERERERE